MNQIPDYTPEELNFNSECMQERYSEVVSFEQAVHELQLNKVKDLNS